MLLNVSNLNVFYDRAMLLNNVSIYVDKGELVGLIGSNGAGKSTLLRTITGLVQWEKEIKKHTKHGNIRVEGVIEYAGEDITWTPAPKIAQKKLIHCPERRRPFFEMTTFENLKAGGRLLGKIEFSEELEKVYTIFPILKEREHQISGTLSGGEQQMLAIARALLQKPDLLCIDEPSLGIAPKIKESIFESIESIHKSGVTILLVEQDVGYAFSISNRNYVLSQGKIISEGKSEELLESDIVKRSYLGL